jgi:hypothetical protein
MRGNIRNAILTFLTALVIILVFAFLDYLAHSTSDEYAVPPRYFPNKIIYGTLIGFVTLLITRKLKTTAKSFIFSTTVAILLQTRYYLEGYPKDFVFLFLAIHFIILYTVSSIVLRTKMFSHS